MFRSLREAIGSSQGAVRLPWLLMGILCAAALANPRYAWVARRWPRCRFAPRIYWTGDVIGVRGVSRKAEAKASFE